MGALVNTVTIGNSEECKKFRRHNRILTNEELRSNEPQFDIFFIQCEQIGINCRRITEIVL